MEEKKKHKVMIGIEVILLGMILAIVGTNAASSNPPSNGVSYSKNSQTTVEGALDDLYNKANYGTASAGQILSGKTALVGGSKVTGTMPSKNGSSKATKVSGNASNLYMVFPYGYYPAETHFSTTNSSEVYASNADVASAIGLTKEKLLKGQTILGITGTGTTGVDTSDATATAADISKGKTAYVNGNKITGTGMQGKTYEFSNKQATVSGQSFNGNWKDITTVNGTTDFIIDLGFTPTKVNSCHINLTGNYSSTNQNRWDADFRMTRIKDTAGSTFYWYTMNIPNDFYQSTSQSVNNYTDTYTKCVVEGSKLKLRIGVMADGTGNGKNGIETRATEFYLSGVLAYD